MKLDNVKLKRIVGDASFRTFYRKKKARKNSIIVFSKKEKEKNLLIYDAVNKRLLESYFPQKTRNTSITHTQTYAQQKHILVFTRPRK